MTGPQVAPFALVRLAALACPGTVAGDFRTAMSRLVAAESTVALPDAVAGSVATLSAAVLGHWPSALAAERAVLAELCTAEPLRRAAALTSPGLLDEFERAGSENHEAEATVLRHALRATSMTSPLSWYTYVAWGHWDDGADFDQKPVARSQVNQVLVARLTAAMMRERRDSIPHRLAPGLRERDGRVTFRRDVPVAGATRAYVTKEEIVGIAATGPLQFVLDAVGPAGTTPPELAAVLARKLPVDQASAAAKFVDQLLDIGLLVPVAPLDPQDPDPLPALGLAELAKLTETFASLGSRERPGRLADLSARWAELGHPDVPPVVEDVVLPRVVRADRSGMDALARLTPLMALFDRQLLVRRIARDRFVERFGAGATARPADCAELYADALLTSLTNPPAVRAHLGEITDDMVEMAAGTAPARPVAYSWFVQRAPDGLVVNHCYAGFTRFASRFLNQLPDRARIDVVSYLSAIFPAGITQFRPVGGCTANLHPKLDQEAGEDPAWSDVAVADLVVHHDQATDELRLLHRGRPIDVLYLGALMPSMLPGRVAALCTDLSCGRPRLDDLRSTVEQDGVVQRDRLWYRDVVLARRSWDFPAVPQFGDGPDAALAVAGWRARYGLPEHVFVGAVGGITATADFEAPEPQYVDLGNALHLHCLARTLDRYTGPLRVTEALPVPSGRVVELVAETWWRSP